MIRILSSDSYQNDIKKIIEMLPHNVLNDAIMMRFLRLTTDLFQANLAYLKGVQMDLLKYKYELLEAMADAMISVTILQKEYKISDVELEAEIRRILYKYVHVLLETE